MVKGHERSIYSISWRKAPVEEAGDRGWLASVSGDGKINVWDVRVSFVHFSVSVGSGTLTVCNAS